MALRWLLTDTGARLQYRPSFGHALAEWEDMPAVNAAGDLFDFAVPIHHAIVKHKLNEEATLVAVEQKVPPDFVLRGPRDYTTAIISWVKPSIELPPPREVVMVTGWSGYSGPHEQFLANAYHSPSHEREPWRDIMGDALSDSGWKVQFWAKMIPLPKLAPEPSV